MARRLLLLVLLAPAVVFSSSQARVGDLVHPPGMLVSHKTDDGTEPSCKCKAGPCAKGAVAFVQGKSICWEQNSTSENQDCKALCSSWPTGGIPWAKTATHTPADTVSIRELASWSWVGTGKAKQSYPGALELLTGNKTHSTMVYFDATSSSGTTASNKSNGQWVLDETARWLATPQQRKRFVADDVAVRSELTVLWGCGDDCVSTSALVNVDSELAKLKFGLMAHFQQTKLIGGVVSTALWGGTAHIQTVFLKELKTDDTQGQNTDDDLSSLPPCCSNRSAVPWQKGWVCDHCPPTCSVCRGSGNRSGPIVPCSSIKWNRGPWGCIDCPMQCSVTGGGHKPSPPGPPPKPKQTLPLHPFSAGSHGDVNGPFEYNGTFHLFKCCDWEHLTAPSAIGPWRSWGVETSPAAGGQFISGSVTVVDGVPRAVMPYNAGNNNQCCVGLPSNGTWKYPCVANPPTHACFQDYMMSEAIAPLTDPTFPHWQPFPQQTLLVNHTAGHPGHGWVQQDPSRAWKDRAPHDPDRWLFLGGTSINGSEASPNGVGIIEIWGSRAGSDWCKGFEYLGVFSASGLAMCDPELIIFPGTEVAALYVCSSKYLLGTVNATDTAWEFQPLKSMPGSRGGLSFGHSVVGGSAKGFWDIPRSRYIMWLNGHYGFTLAREVTLDKRQEMLLFNPAREYALMRQHPEANLTGASVAEARAALAAAKGSPQLDIALSFHVNGNAGFVPGDRVGVVLSGVEVVIIFAANAMATLNAGKNTMEFHVSDGGTALLRVIVDGPVLEAFAQDGRAQVTIAASEVATTLGLVANTTTGTNLLVGVGVWPLRFPPTP